jgi:hypothetical protein
MDHSIATVIHYCSNEYRFLKKSVEEAKKFSRLIVIPVCDHFFNGKKENRALLNRTYQEFPDCQFIEFAYDPRQIYHPSITNFSPGDREWGFFWHSASRYIAGMFLPPDIEYALFLDGDEIVDGNRFLRWLDTGAYRSVPMMRFQSYIYLSAELRRSDPIPSAIMVQASAIDSSAMNGEDRPGWYEYFSGPKRKNIFDDQKVPLIHHYSWVRTREECLHKSKTWAHRRDDEWKKIVDQMMKNFDDPTVWCKELGFQFSIEKTDVFFDPFSVGVPPGLRAARAFPNVLKVDEPLVRRKQIERMIGA